MTLAKPAYGIDLKQKNGFEYRCDFGTRDEMSCLENVCLAQLKSISAPCKHHNSLHFT